jgi:hypothetical protein
MIERAADGHGRRRYDLTFLDDRAIGDLADQ